MAEDGGVLLEVSAPVASVRSPRTALDTTPRIAKAAVFKTAVQKLCDANYDYFYYFSERRWMGSCWHCPFASRFHRAWSPWLF